MNICFYADHPYWSQLSPNGGTSTILRSVITLRSLGLEANVVATKDTFRWFKHPKPIPQIPKNADVCIAVTVSDIKPMLARMPKKAKAFYWARLPETHQMPKDKLMRHASKVTTLANSENLRDWFGKHGVEATIAYQGVDLSWWKDDGAYPDKVLGFLVSNKERKHFDMVMAIVGELKGEYNYVGYGAGKDQDGKTKGFAARNFHYFKTDLKRPALAGLYNLCSTWVVTSTKEGLHNPPIEAGLCGAAVVYPDARLGGCSDHCINRQTAWEYEAFNLEDACRAIRASDKSRNKAHKELIKEKIGDRTTAMKRLVEICSR